MKKAILRKEPNRNCPLCPRLVAYRERNQIDYPDFHNAPVPTWVPEKNLDSVELLIIGLAPGLKGANRTGRPFTGDFAGNLLYETLTKHGFAKGEYAADPNDGLQLHRTAITNAVRCLPPQNKPIGVEINTCRQFLIQTLSQLKNLKVLVTLGGIAHASTMKTLDLRISDHPFVHNRIHDLGTYKAISSYHCSRYNTQTKRLTPEMFDSVFLNVSNLLN